MWISPATVDTVEILLIRQWLAMIPSPEMLSPTKYPILLALFALIFATVAHAAPMAAGLSRVGRDDTIDITPGTQPEDNRTLKERLDSIAEKDTKLKETNWAGVDVDTKVAAYVPIFKEIDAGIGLIAEGDITPEAQKMREWRKWEKDKAAQFDGERAGQEYKDDAPTAGNVRGKRRMLA